MKRLKSNMIKNIRTNSIVFGFKNGIIFLLFLFVINICSGQNLDVLLKTDFDGKVTQGSIEKLIESIREGNGIRIGWSLDFNNDGIADLEHWIDADFLSILNGHVFNQIEPIYAQSPNSELPQIEIGNSSIKWTAIIGTNGKLISRFIIPDIQNITDENYRKQMEIMSQINEQLVQTIWVKN